MRVLTFLFVLLDWFFATVSWGAFYYFRKVLIEKVEFTTDSTFYIGICAVPILWLLIFYFQGTYYDVKRLFRFRVFNLTFAGVLIGSVLLFFTLLLDDQINSYQEYYKSILLLFSIYFLSIVIPRLIFVTIVVKKIHQGKMGFKTLLIGGSDRAVEIYNELVQSSKRTNDFIGFVNLNGVDRKLEGSLEYLGHADQLETIMMEYEIEEVIIALESVEHDRLKSIISRIEGGDLVIKILPDMYDILSGSVKMTNIFGALLIEVNAEVMPFWQQSTKRFIDVLISVLALIILLPLYIVLALLVKVSSPGPVFFLQERIGKNGKPFQIIKYRTMYVDAEKLGPQLSSSHDPRITPVGRFLRKTRLDEFPQFINVIMGDMSLVGPRPERQYYIDQISAIEPQYLHLNKVRPGITSWGQVKFGYAENVDQMLQRMKFDLLYLKNRSLALDFKIMLYTVLIIFKGSGK
ncbi:MAG: sugar transferase [Bacteroidetes bacterium]|nr:MAG: sugar transferase [Bacteroidota bacterium]